MVCEQKLRPNIPNRWQSCEVGAPCCWWPHPAATTNLQPPHRLLLFLVASNTRLLHQLWFLLSEVLSSLCFHLAPLRSSREVKGHHPPILRVCGWCVEEDWLPPPGSG